MCSCRSLFCWLWQPAVSSSLRSPSGRFWRCIKGKRKAENVFKMWSPRGLCTVSTSELWWLCSCHDSTLSHPLFPSWHILIEFSRRNQNFLTLSRLVSRHNSISCCCCVSRTPPMTSSKCVEQCTSIGSLSRLRNIYREVECPVHQQFELSALERKKATRIIALAFTQALGHTFHSVQSLFMAGDGQWLKKWDYKPGENNLEMVVKQTWIDFRWNRIN